MIHIRERGTEAWWTKTGAEEWQTRSGPLQGVGTDT
jgi:hypothetical protein